MKNAEILQKDQNGKTPATSRI